jgi:hypothetical protein
MAPAYSLRPHRTQVGEAMNRMEIVDKLVNSMLKDAQENEMLLREIFWRGFPGLSAMSDAKLLREAELRGISVAKEIDFPSDDDVADDLEAGVAYLKSRALDAQEEF